MILQIKRCFSLSWNSSEVKDVSAGFTGLRKEIKKMEVNMSDRRNICFEAKASARHLDFYLLNSVKKPVKLAEWSVEKHFKLNPR